MAASDKGSKYTKARHQAIVKAVREGNYRSTAAKLAGISSSAMSHWMDYGAQGEEPYASLLRDIEQAEAEWEAEMLAVVNEAARSRKHGTWTAAMTAMERKSPEKWGRRDAVVVEGGAKPIEVATHHILGNPETLQAVLGQLASVQKPMELPAGEEIEGELLHVEDDFLRP